MAARSPRVSVLLPVRDGEEHLAEALASLSQQTLSDFEAIVVDDGSRDGSAAAAGHARGDRRFRLIRQEPLGLVAALERGRPEARAPILARLDADDVALPERLAAQVDALGGCEVVGGRVAYFSEPTDGLRRYERWLNGLVTADAAARDVFVECPLPHPALAIRREALEAAGGWRVRGWPEDYDLVLRLWRRGARFRNVEELVLRWRDRPGRLSRTDPAYSQEAFIRCKAHQLRASLLAGGRRAVVWGAGPVGKAFALELRRQGTEVAAFVEVDPRKLGKRIHGAPVVPVSDGGRFPGTVALGAVADPRGDGRARARRGRAVRRRCLSLDR